MAAVETKAIYTGHGAQATPTHHHPQHQQQHPSVPDTAARFNTPLPGSPLVLFFSLLEYLSLSNNTRNASILCATLVGVWMAHRLLQRRHKTNAWW